MILACCREPDLLQFNEHLDGDILELTIVASSDDYRVLVGRTGRTIKAIERYVQRAARRQEVKASVALKLGKNSNGVNIHHFHEDPNFDEQTFVSLLSQLTFLAGITAAPSIRLADKILTVEFETTDSEEKAAIYDLHEIFYPMGYKGGRRIRIATVEPTVKRET